MIRPLFHAKIIAEGAKVMQDHATRSAARPTATMRHPLANDQCEENSEGSLVMVSSHRTTELSDSRPAVITPVTFDNPSAPPKPATLELLSGAAVRSSDLVRRRHINFYSTVMIR